MDLSVSDHVLVGLAAAGAGIVNAVAGGGTLITFPTLVALGVPSVRSNVTNTVALCPGYFGGTYAQRGDLVGQNRRLRSLALAAAVGGLVGSILLVITSEKVFKNVVPYLLLVACALLAFQDRIRRMLPERPPHPDAVDPPVPPLLVVAVGLSAVYGGYFGAGLGIITLATLGILLDERISRLNAIKQAISFVTNVVAALFFVFSGKVVWSLALVMAPASLLGGSLGGRLASHLDARVLRGVVVTIGVIVAVKYLLD
ncbi:MAG TPA: sulfite exporter TauE/SafE family protein [Acidimicrobiales bacterium]|nr:sulfite exporter TauE/SafE family protein [Acidimicrobiales bacterium]